jgi:hypothetical protein
MRKTTILMLAAVIILGLLAGSVLYAREAPEEEKKMKEDRLAKVSSEPRWQILNINNLWHWAENNGESAHSRGGDSGTYFPRGQVWCIYKDGIKWSSRCYVDEALTTPAPYGQLIRIGGCDYGSGTREGWVTGSGATAQRVDPGEADARMFKIRRDYYTAFVDAEGEWTSEMVRDAAEYFEKSTTAVTEAEIQEVYDLYAQDWVEWPVDLGAPFIDRDGDGVYTAPPPFSATFTAEDLIDGGYDEPGVAGSDPNSPADMVMWNVFNDLDRNQTLALEGSEPIGIEAQRTMFAYKRTDALGSIYFNSMLMINKGGVDIDEAGTKGSLYCPTMYVGQWSDPDLGSFADDLLGCDTTLSMGYVYNGNSVDREYARFGQVVPAAGYDFMAGPLYEAPGEVAVFNLKYRNGYANLGMTSFSWFSAGSAISDPPSNYTGGLQWDQMLRGYAPITGPDQYYPFPPGYRPSPFPLSGDPVLGTGLIDGLGETYSFAPGDRRLNMASGPFEFFPGDTQQVVIAFVAGQGADRFSSISVMKFNDQFAQKTYDNLFEVPKPPGAPAIAVTEANEEVIITWGQDLTSVDAIENTVAQPGNYVFEGYNVYQFPRSTSTLSEAVRIATYDKATAPPLVFDDQFDQNTGQILYMPVQFGSNSGLQRNFTLDRDYVRDIDRVYNGEEYYLAVTAYSVAEDEGAIPKTLESTPQIITVQPQRSPMGTRYGADAADVVSTDYITHVSGTGDAVIEPTVVAPAKIVDATYTMAWNSDTLWTVVLEQDVYYFTYDLLKNGTTIASDLSNYSLDDDYTILDGILWKVGGLTFAAPDDFTDYDVEGTGTYDIDSYMANGWANTARATDAYGEGTTDASLLQNDIELRFTGEYGTQTGTVIPIEEGTGSIATVYSAPSMADHPLNPNPGSTDRFTVRIPFEAWDVDRGIQINVLMRDRLQEADSDPFYAFNPAGRMYVFFNALPYQETVLTSDTDENLTWNMVFWETDWETGDVVTFQYANKMQGDDEYQVDTGTYVPTEDNETAKLDVERIQVYPNPYYAFNPSELSRLARFVTFNNLPQLATIRIFNLAGQLVRIIEKDNPTSFQRWDLLNHDGLPVASGMYIAHIEVTLPTDGSTQERILKFAIVQEQEVLDVY